MRSINLVGQHFTKTVGPVKVPYLDQMAGYYVFGGTAAASTPNLAYGASQNLTLVGTPTYGTGYAVIDGTNGFETGLLMDAPFTQFALVYQPTASLALAVFGRGAGNTDNFVDMLVWKNNGTGGYGVDGYPDGTGSSSLSPALNPLNGSNFVFIAQTWGGTGTRDTVFALQGTSFLVAPSTSSVTRTVTPTHTLKIGTGYTGGSAGTTRIAMAGLVAGILSYQQLYDIGIYARAWVSSRGIAMV